MNECDTCIHNRGSYCDAEACNGGDGYEDNRVRLCPACGGRLSGLRRSQGHFIRHCYSCHLEFPIDARGNARRVEERA